MQGTTYILLANLLMKVKKYGKAMALSLGQNYLKTSIPALQILAYVRFKPLTANYFSTQPMPTIRLGMNCTPYLYKTTQALRKPHLNCLLIQTLHKQVKPII